MAPYSPRLTYLLERYRDGAATPAERAELMEILRTGEMEEPVRQWLLETVQQTFGEGGKGDDELGEERAEQLLSGILQAGRVADGLAAGRRAPVRRMTVWRVAAAACLLLLVAFGGYLIVGKKKPAVFAVNNRGPKQDVAPGKHAAVLTLAGGQQIFLDSAQSGTVGRQGNVTVINMKGMLSYQGLPAGAAPESTYNTLTTNAGNQYQLILPDGSRVWLNAESSIRYPVSFGNKERKVEISGEAYFEVTASANHPFVVQHGSAVVQVLGTSFNMSTYEDEAALTTTLLQGSIRFGRGPGGRLIRPGQQARLDASGALTVVDDVNTEEVIAWKNDLFYFRGADMNSIMRQLTRWYGIRVEGNTHIPERFYAKIPKSANLTEVLNAFSLTEKVHFEIEGKTVKILP
ncbi:MAG: FecR domain-containing protein [Bacteroidetes bacterium]|nr:FecR domain-containing protein [Bacteroidota bacterium]